MTRLIMAATLVAAVPGAASPTDETPRELGRVKWGTDLDAALAASAQSGKPVLLLFQEIPGCQTCVDFGQSPLTHPLLVEAIDDDFLPVAIHNNRPGRDAEILKRFDEPAWNNPVMRFLDAKGHDLLPRRDHIWQTGQVARRLVEAIEAAKREAPEYLKLAAAETDPGRPQKATFAMHCFWEGEAKLGSLPGIIATRAGFLERNEVVEVVYDEEVLGYGDLLQGAQRLDCATMVYAHDRDQLKTAERLGTHAALLGESARAKDAPPSDQKHALNDNPLRYLPLTPAQATRVNADVAAGRDPAPWLSPRQQELLEQIKHALTADTESLRGLERPESPKDLADYQDRLVARLETRDGRP